MTQTTYEREELHIGRNIKRLERLKEKLIKMYRLQAEVAELQSHFLPNSAARLRLEIILQVVSKKFNIGYQTLCSNERTEEVVTPRHIIFFIARDLQHIKLVLIAKAFRRDHGCVLHAQRAIRNRMQTDRKFADMVGDLSKECNAIISQTEEQKN
jgi:chromosomal replication initiation ATPase DnaA